MPAGADQIERGIHLKKCHRPLVKGQLSQPLGQARGQAVHGQLVVRTARSLKASSTPSPVRALLDCTHQPFSRSSARLASLIAHCSLRSLLFKSSTNASLPYSCSTRSRSESDTSRVEGRVPSATSTYPAAPRRLVMRNELMSSSPARSQRMRFTVRSARSTVFLSILTPTVVR